LDQLPKKYSFNQVSSFIKNRKDPSQLVKLYKSRKAYLHPSIRYEEKTCILDIGAFVGDTSLLFHELAPQAQIFAFEPVSINYKLLEENVKKYSRIVPVHAGMWKENGSAYFSVNKVNPRTNTLLGSKQKEKVKLFSIDSFVAKEKIIPDLIKLEVEGVEKEVLEGAENTIREFKPDLIVPLYHKGADLVEIPYWLMEKFPFYKYFLYHTEVFISSTILIAVAGV